MRSVELLSPVDVAGFRSAARALIREGVPPEDVSWETQLTTRGLFAAAPATATAPSPTFKVPAAFLRLAEDVALHRDADRFALLYRLLWRLRAEPRLLQVSMDADVSRAHAMAKSVHRDIHKMHAFVRFRRIAGIEPEAFVAWFEPQHYIVEAATPFFARRFANTPWAIITPERRAVWDLHTLAFGPGGHRSEVPAEDAAEDLWRSYYASIFNPARLKVNSMRGHMPQKYWRNLPESPLIPGLIAASQRRTQTMIDTSISEPSQRHLRVAESRAHERLAEAAPQDLRSQIQDCRRCPLGQHATQSVAGEGPADARIVLVGEQPGDQEDIEGRPFVGPAGQLLNRALTEAGLRRESLYVTNAVKHFKFEVRGKRRLHKSPGQREVMACHAWLQQELATVQPHLIVALGATATRSLLGRSVSIQQTRGKVLSHSRSAAGAGSSLLITVHPSALLRMPESQRMTAFDDLVRDLRLALPFATDASTCAGTASNR